MFTKQRLKLTILNTMVFFILFTIFNVVIYFYIKSNTYMAVDRALQNTKKIIENNIDKIIEEIPKVEAGLSTSSDYGQTKQIKSRNTSSIDPRIIVIFRDEKGNILYKPLLSSFYRNNLDNIRPTALDRLYDIKFNNFHFRTISFSAQTNEKTLMIQLLRNTNSEKEYLDTLLGLIIVGGVILLILSIGAGTLLAQKTMIPIVKAWDKQRQFVEDASHELRTPLTVIQSQLELILKKPETTVLSNSDHLGTALSEARRLSKLTSNLLTLARSDSNILEIERKPIDISLLVKKIVEPYIELAFLDEKNINLELPKELIVYCDVERITQLMIILLDNALKYTNEGDNISVSIVEVKSNCSITVKDTGIGITPNESKLVFERFYRGDKSRTRKTGGTGLGLSIAKWIVEAHKGTITASPNHPKGTIIKINIPVV